MKKFHSFVLPLLITIVFAGFARADQDDGKPARRLRADTPVSGTWRARDELGINREFVDWYTISEEQGATATVTVEAEISPFLYVKGPSDAAGKLHFPEDDAKTITVEFVLAEEGEYQVGVSAGKHGREGRYTVSLSIGSGSQPSTGIPTNLEAELTARDRTLEDGRNYDEYEVTFPAGAQVTCDMGARNESGLDCYLFVIAPDGQVHENDDAEDASPWGNRTDSHIVFVAQGEGVHTIRCTSFEAGQLGAYILNVTLARPLPSPVLDLPEVAVGATIEGQIVRSDPKLESGKLYKAFLLRGTPGEKVKALLEGKNGLDTYLYVQLTSGWFAENDDRTRGDTNSEIEFSFGTDGLAIAYCTTYDADTTGAFKLSVMPGPQLWGIFVGIRDYPPGTNDLQYCDEDATLLARSFKSKGLLNDACAIVLTNAQATRANIRGAFEQVARSANPWDHFIFFYSGHGMQSEPDERNTDEADLRQESLYVYDGELQDDTMNEYFNLLSCKVQVIVLDACFSGGFADVISRPGRVGFFASEEDLTSNVAMEFGAGGYLSLFFREAIEGKADTNSDGMVALSELSHYLYKEYAARAGEATSVTNEGVDGWQHLVHMRSVTIDTELFPAVGPSRGGNAPVGTPTTQPVDNVPVDEF
ncbi:MAG: caspase family protein [Planctomycetes bacterium]|nr:caspase family protein [Planctomycetota bacterium]